MMNVTHLYHLIDKKIADNLMLTTLNSMCDVNLVKINVEYSH